MTAPRRAERTRGTRETQVRVSVDLEGTGAAEIRTGVGFYDHLLTSLAHHSLIDLVIEAQGDLEIDEHHTVEDVALTLGQALAEALGDRAGIARFGDATVPMDESLARCALDLSGRPHPRDPGRTHPSDPFVDATPVRRGSASHATRSARARALNAASAR